MLASGLLGGDSELSPDGSCCWHIENKYYSVDVRIHVHQPGDEADEHASTCEAVVIVGDVTNQTAFENVKQWMEKNDDACNAEV